MSELDTITNTESGGLSKSLKVKLSFNYKGKRYIAPIAESLVSEAKSRINQFRTQTRAHNIGNDHPEISTIGPLTYYVGRDEKGYKQGGEVQWQYMQGLCDEQITSADKLKQLQITLAQLPSNVSYVFKADPNLRDRDIVREAFNRAGFVNNPRITLLYKGSRDKDGQAEDELHFMKSAMRKKIRAARRDLELTPMDIDSFFDFYRENLGAKESYFPLNIDQELMKQAANAEKPLAKIIAVRRKPNEAGTAQPVEAALLCSTGSDGYLRLIRGSFRRASEGQGVQPRYSNAFTMVIVEAMKLASDRHMVLDMNGFTPRGYELYSRIGNFDKVVHDHFERRTPQSAVGNLMTRIFG